MKTENQKSKQLLIDEHLAKPYEAGETVYIKGLG